MVVDEDRIFVAGGDSQVSEHTNLTFMYEHRDGRGLWTRLQDMPTNRRALACGLVDNGEDNGGKEIVAAGGFVFTYVKIVEIYSVDTGTWRSGKRRSPLTNITISQELLASTMSFIPHFEANCLAIIIQASKAMYILWFRCQESSKTVQIYLLNPVVFSSMAFFAFISAPDLPEALALPATVPYRDTFLVIGGKASDGTLIDRIYAYNAANESFVQLEQRLNGGRSYAVPMMVDPLIFPPCTRSDAD